MYNNTNNSLNFISSTKTTDQQIFPCEIKIQKQLPTTNNLKIAIVL